MIQIKPNIFNSFHQIKTFDAMLNGYIFLQLIWLRLYISYGGENQFPRW